MAARDCGTASPFSAITAAMRSGIRPGGINRSSFASNTGTVSVTAAALTSILPRSTGPDVRQVFDRLAGARRAVDEISDASLDVIQAPGLTVVDGRSAGRSLIERNRADRPDAIFTVNDLLAIGLLQALVMSGDVAVPGDIALVGYDDIDFASATVVPLTSVQQPSGLIGKTAVRILLDEADDPTLAVRDIVFTPTLVVRESTVDPTSRSAVCTP